MFAVFESSNALHHPCLEGFLSLPVIMVTTEERSPIAELHVRDSVCRLQTTLVLVSSMIALR